MKENKGKISKNRPEVDLEQLVFGMVEELPERSKDIIIKRFNFDGDKEIRTLEKIGSEYKITRERVRQIEFEAISRLKNVGKKYNIDKVFESIKSSLENCGGVAGEEKIISCLFDEDGNSGNKTSKQITLFILSLDDRMKEMGETRIHKKVYFYEKENAEKFKNVIRKIEEHLEKNKKDANFYELLELINKRFKNEEVFSPLCLKSYLNENKIILKSVLGRWGHTKWPHINPKNVRDKSYLTLKKGEKPLHFIEITNRINELWNNDRVANNQTVHNELIKDARFVLIGRGIYALKEWGYSAGTVLDIIVKILKENGGEMGKDDIIQEVLKRRKVRKNTIVLNLQNREHFEKVERKVYRLK